MLPSVAPGPASSASPGSWLELQPLGPAHKISGIIVSIFKKIPRCLVCVWKFEKLWPTPLYIQGNWVVGAYCAKAVTLGSDREELLPQGIGCFLGTRWYAKCLMSIFLF